MVYIYFAPFCFIYKIPLLNLTSLATKSDKASTNISYFLTPPSVEYSVKYVFCNDSG